MWAFLGSLLGLVVKVVAEWFLARAEARKREEEFKLDQKKFHDLVEAAMQKQRESQAKLSQGAGNAWDQADKDKKP